MSRYTLITLAAAALFLIGEAHALTLTNRDGSQQRLEISEGGEELSRRIVIEPDQTIEEVEGGVNYTQSVEGEVGGFFKVAEGMVAKQVESGFENDLNTLKAILEG